MFYNSTFRLNKKTCSSLLKKMNSTINMQIYQDMNLSRPLMKAVNDLDYITPTPIQQAAIPVILKGRDVSGCAATGTGKF